MSTSALPPSSSSSASSPAAAVSRPARPASPVATATAHAVVTVGGRPWRLDLRRPDADLCMPVRPYADAATVPSAFYLPKPHCAPTRSGEWVGSVAAGASVNVPTLSMCVHGSCTHTECLGHIVAGDLTLGDLEPVPPIIGGTLLAVAPERLGASGETYGGPKAAPDDLVITARGLRAALARVFLKGGAGRKADRGGGGDDASDADVAFDDPRDAAFVEAVVVRAEYDVDASSSSNSSGTGDAAAAPSARGGSLPAGHDFSGSNPPYFTLEAMQLLCGGEGGPPPGTPLTTVAANAANAAADGAAADGAAADGAAVVARALPSQATTTTTTTTTTAATREQRRLQKGLGVRHLLVNLPSVDREDDGGGLQNHRFVFRHPPGAPAPDVVALRARGTRLPCFSVTELCSVPAAAPEGRVLLSLQVSPIEMDAAPSRPLLYYLDDGDGDRGDGDDTTGNGRGAQ